MKIAIPTQGRTLEGVVNPSFGRAERFIVVDGVTREFEVIENRAASAQGGAGIKAAQIIVDSGARVLITFQCGQNAAEVLKAAGIKIIEAVPGSITNIVDKHMGGQLRELADIHPGFHGGR